MALNKTRLIKGGVMMANLLRRKNMCETNGLCFVSLEPLKDADKVIEYHSDEMGYVSVHRKYIKCQGK